MKKFRLGESVEIPKGWRLLHSHERVAAGDTILHPNGVEESIPSRHYMIGCGSYHNYGGWRIVIRRKIDPDKYAPDVEADPAVLPKTSWRDGTYAMRAEELKGEWTNLHVPGTKDDKAKPRPTLVFRGFADALAEVVEVATFGARKYTDDGWSHVPNGIARYHDAMYRHLKEWDGVDSESGRSHLAHAAWNLLAVMQLLHNEAQEEQS